MADKTKIEKLVLNIRGKKIELNLDEAKELKSALSEIFGKDTVIHVDHHHDHWDRYPWKPWYGTYWSGTLSTLSNAGSNDFYRSAQCYQMNLNAGSMAESTT